jgi:hypothetical protein
MYPWFVGVFVVGGCDWEVDVITAVVKTEQNMKLFVLLFVHKIKFYGDIFNLNMMPAQQARKKSQ